MRYFGTLALAAGALGISGLACSNSDSAPKTTLSAVVAPLDLPAATDACYHLTVWNAEDPDEGEQVWDQPLLCASQYGANNGIRFTGICDAQAGVGDADPDNDGKNAIRLILNDIYKEGDFDEGTALTAGEDYINPCPAPVSGEDNGCVLIADCAQNQDTKVEFNLTVMRQAELGFFDTVVKIHDVFCAAKLDCLDQNDEMLTYLPDPNNNNADGPTAVLGFTCLGGDGADINMYLDDIVITCGEDTVTIDPSEGPGHVGHTTDIVSGAEGDFVFGAAVNTGTGFQGSRYWNVLIGMNASPSGDGCTLTTRGTVSEVALEGTPFSTPPHTRYPFIQWDVPLHDGSAPLTCARHPLNGGSGVSTEYSDIDSPQLLAHKLALAPPAVVCPCWGGSQYIAAVEALASQPDSEIEYGSSTSDVGGYTYVEVEGGNGAGVLYAGDVSESWFGSGPGPFCSIEVEIGSLEGEISIQPISAEELAVCLHDILAIANDACAVNNGGCGGSTPHCVYGGPGVATCVECQQDADCQNGTLCNTSTYSCEPANPCTVNNGGCGASACWNDGQFSRQCVACVADADCAQGMRCDLTGSPSPSWHMCVACLEDVDCGAGTTCDDSSAGSPTWLTCTECGPRANAQASYYCAGDAWCTHDNICVQPQSQLVVEVNPASRTWESWQSACAALGGYHRAHDYEIASAMQTYFQNGTNVGYTFIVNNGMLNSRYLSVEGYSLGFIFPPGSWNGAQYVFGDGTSMNQHLLCFRD